MAFLGEISCVQKQIASYTSVHMQVFWCVDVHRQISFGLTLLLEVSKLYVCRSLRKTK